MDNLRIGEEDSIRTEGTIRMLSPEIPGLGKTNRMSKNNTTKLGMIDLSIHLMF